MPAEEEHGLLLLGQKLPEKGDLASSIARIKRILSIS
jgi:hypothetical protein